MFRVKQAISADIWWEKEHGKRILYEQGSITAKAQVRGTHTVVRADGSTERVRPADLLDKWVALAQDDGDAAKVLRLLDRDKQDWVNLRRILERIEGNVGGELTLARVVTWRDSPPTGPLRAPQRSEGSYPSWPAQTSG